MASLPSFVELMASLGLESTPQATQSEQSPISTPPVQESPRMARIALSRPSSSPTLRESASRNHPRYSPYGPTLTSVKRRDSLSSVSSSDFESSPLSATFPGNAYSLASRTRKYRHKLTVATYGSTSDLNADTPISTYVRRKTPGTSPTSPSFHNPADSGYESSSPSPMPFSIPSLPVLLPYSASSESFPNTPTSDSDSDSSHPTFHTVNGKLSVITEGHNYYRFIRRRTGTRISTPPRSARSDRPRRKPAVEEMQS